MEIRVPSLDFDEIKVIDANGELQTYSLKQELNINGFNVKEEFYSHPAKYVYWTSLLERMKLQQESDALALERCRASLYEPTRVQYVNAGVTKPTKDQIEAGIQLDPTYQQLSEVLLKTKYIVGKLQYTVKAFEHRRDMLIQIGAELRRENDFSKKVNPINTTQLDPTKLTV
jgi:hypothetical protein